MHRPGSVDGGPGLDPCGCHRAVACLKNRNDPSRRLPGQRWHFTSRNSLGPRTADRIQTPISVEFKKGFQFRDKMIDDTRIRASLAEFRQNGVVRRILYQDFVEKVYPRDLPLIKFLLINLDPGENLALARGPGIILSKI